MIGQHLELSQTFRWPFVRQLAAKLGNIRPQGRGKKGGEEKGGREGKKGRKEEKRGAGAMIWCHIMLFHALLGLETVD